MKIEFITADCIQYMRALPEASVDVVVTSPPYNLEIDYGTYKDKRPMEHYLDWSDQWISCVKRVLSPTGSFFLNVGGSSTNPWIPHDVAAVARRYFTLQNHIIWVKSISIQNTSYGHFKPRNSQNQT
jgi:site-specific DNA-methyltransferase (adenine-specific)